ncbi:Nickel/cobalt homeostasis protein RcnB precursor [Raoultella terrigena]|uniref:Nickel/cobalt homeostasis protein RcnB n=1 Tax=Raoultella terrigena TaxID=577 RepID=A0A3P8M410_RAOTE|nr:Nickel/cobalt homeostasis protein RcnB precursor [Raoultella terrigena]
MSPGTEKAMAIVSRVPATGRRETRRTPIRIMAIIADRIAASRGAHSSIVRIATSRSISPGTAHDFRKGQPAPERYRGNAYRINNWNDRGLPAPPQGQHWSYIDGNYVLIAAATGIITSILVNGLLNN